MKNMMQREFRDALEPEFIARVLELRRSVADAALIARDLAMLSSNTEYIYEDAPEPSTRVIERPEYTELREKVQTELSEMGMALTEVHEDLVSMTMASGLLGRAPDTGSA